MRKYNVVAHVASLHNKQNLFGEVGLYNLDYNVCGDYELLLRKKNKLKFYYLPKQIGRMSIGGISFSSKAIFELYKIRSFHKSVSFLANISLLIFNLSAFYFFIFRKKFSGASL